jgi:hypothetical protein
MHQGGEAWGVVYVKVVLPHSAIRGAAGRGASTCPKAATPGCSKEVRHAALFSQRLLRRVASSGEQQQASMHQGGEACRLLKVLLPCGCEAFAQAGHARLRLAQLLNVAAVTCSVTFVLQLQACKVCDEYEAFTKG